MPDKKKKKTDAEEGEKKKKGKKLFVVPVLIIVLAGGAYFYMGMSKKPAAGAAGGPPTTVGGTLVEETSLTVNLRDNHYLQFTAALEVASKGSSKILATDQAVVLDILNTQAGAMTEPELLKAGGPAELKANIMKAINQEWPGLVTAVYFEQFTMQ
jgi:flagellar basal body-associated protein FliL